MQSHERIVHCKVSFSRGPACFGIPLTVSLAGREFSGTMGWNITSEFGKSRPPMHRLNLREVITKSHHQKQQVSLDNRGGKKKKSILTIPATSTCWLHKIECSVGFLAEMGQLILRMEPRRFQRLTPNSLAFFRKYIPMCVEEEYHLLLRRGSCCFHFLHQKPNAEPCLWSWTSPVLWRQIHTICFRLASVV